MSVRTMPAAAGRDTRPRPVAWRGMAWVTWRQHRAALTGMAVFLGGFAVYLWLTGPTAEADQYSEQPVVHVRRGAAQAHLLVRATADGPVPPGWQARPVSLEELTLAYLRGSGRAAPHCPGEAWAGRGDIPSEVTR